MTDARAAALHFLRRGWAPIPLPFQAKIPTLTGWPALRLTEPDLPAYFNGAPQNVALLTGTPSHNLVDVDLDVPEARRLAPQFLPATERIHGRPSAHTSHY